MRRRAGADHEVNALGFAGIVVVEKELRLLCQDRFAILVIAVLGAASGADDLLRRNAIYASPNRLEQSPGPHR